VVKVFLRKINDVIYLRTKARGYNRFLFFKIKSAIISLYLIFFETWFLIIVVSNSLSLPCVMVYVCT
jgi:hypothetical protein